MSDVRSALYSSWRQKYVRAAGNAYYVDYNQKQQADPKNAMTCSEAHGYGMLLSVYNNNRPDFDGFLRYFDLFVNKKGLMGWQQVKTPTMTIIPSPEGGTNSATDGDIDIAHALWLAGDKWSMADYHSRAITLCRAIFEHTVNKDLWCLTLGDWVTKNDKKFWHITRTSDFILAAIDLFAKRDVERRTGWETLRENIINIIQQLYAAHPVGLLPDFATFEHGRWDAVKGEVLESKHDPHFHYNACRTPWRLAAYLKQTGDQRVLPVLHSMAHFFDHQGEILAGYKLDGKPYADYGDKAFTAPAWACLHIVGSPHASRIWKAISDEECDYFGDSIEALSAAQLL